jgi:SAM-dependent methyltransferase
VSDWTDGYVAEIDYTYGYYTELNPLRIVVPFLNVGLAPPAIATACELGFGQGISVNIHAAAAAATWYGTDFNPAHAAFARSLAAASGAGAQLFDQPFAEFCTRPDLPDFDYIALHGIWSWITEENRRAILDFIGRKLKVGGVLYISYNCQPGFAAMTPLRHLLTLYAEAMVGSGRGIVARLDAALEFIDRLLMLNPAFAVANPTIADRLRVMKGHSRQYLAHELLNREWRPMLFGEMVRWLGQEKLTYAGSAHYLDHVEALNMLPEQQRFIAEIPDPAFRQSVRDFMVNQQFRRDYWVKGARRLTPLEQTEALRRVRVMLPGQRGAIAFTVAGSLGQREMTRTIYEPILDALGIGETRTLGELESMLSGAGMRLAALYEAIMVLAGKGDLVLVQDADIQERVKPHSDRLNRQILDKARSSGDILHLASPATGGGIAVGRFLQLFLLARAHGKTAADELARFVWDLLAAQGQRVLKDGKALETAEDNLAELGSQARDFIDNRLATLQALKIA